ncbi:dipeptidase E [Hyunsoonleella jejuensis]|uniref:dipeptidase E n=1 Tax=Hyunsoonleella jejuensis TaxID=419940 RepID=A0A1H9D483_9FLAO|nr:dipeptidase PepE [Hyunsoonleella jejuensis]SEQ07653.1 dipeptidase E [Hyunsoonleella jejuensis]
MKHIIIASTSTVHGSSYLDYIIEELSVFFKEVKTIVFVPYARPSGISHDDYTEVAKKAFAKIGINVVGLHTYKNPSEAIENAEGIFTGGGNTFVLANQLHKNNLIAPLKNAVNNGTPYLGTSAGSNICGLTIKTTNDMPIVYPPSFNALGLVPFNINPHYLDPDTNSTHMGETRETRIKEFHCYNSQPVVGLREGSWLSVEDNNITLQGPLSARIFEYNKPPYEVESGSTLTNLK